MSKAKFAINCARNAARETWQDVYEPDYTGYANVVDVNFPNFGY